MSSNGNGNGGALASLRQATARSVPEGMEMVIAPEMSANTNIAAVAAAEQARARIQARTLMAFHRPRVIDQVRRDLLKECERPRFAEAAIYEKPIGGGKTVSGMSIRFAEAALRHFRNVDIETVTAYEDDTRRVVRVSVIDLETNASYSLDVQIEKTVERSSTTGREVVGQRTNSQNKITYIVKATEDELMVKQSAAVSKAIRTNGLRLIPGDLIDECVERIYETQKNGGGDPDARRKAMVDSFADIGVPPAALKDYLGHDLGMCSEAEMRRLRGIYQAIRDGETTWVAVVEQRGGNGNGEAGNGHAEPPAEQPAPAAGRADPAKRAAELLANASIPAMRKILGGIFEQDYSAATKDAMLPQIPEAVRRSGIGPDEMRLAIVDAGG